MTLRVVGAGLGRTGTHSLKLALEQLLGGPCYHMVEVFGHPEHVPVWRDAALLTLPKVRAFVSPTLTARQFSMASRRCLGRRCGSRSGSLQGRKTSARSAPPSSHSPAGSPLSAGAGRESRRPLPHGLPYSQRCQVPEALGGTGREDKLRLRARHKEKFAILNCRMPMSTTISNLKLAIGN